ncbi:MAG: ATP-binding cassette domain-containing protein, partial [Patescibacteria group bacterium]
TVLDRVNCEIGGGEFVSVVGPSGAGKTTFVNLLTGAIHPSEGTVSVDSYTINELDEISLALYLRKVGVIFQDYKLLPKKTVWENVAFALEVCGDRTDLIKKRVDEVLDIVGLTHRARAFPTQLSGGECQRTALARALVHEPALVIGDEPTGNLDPESGAEIIDLLLDINKAGATVVLATHDRETVDRVKRRVIRLEKGKLVSDLDSAKYHPK